jgi:hypothetical protein
MLLLAILSYYRLFHLMLLLAILGYYNYFTLNYFCVLLIISP